jgi:hypothetical protein
MPQPNSHKVWFGASKGFGHVWTEAALARGDSVTAAARNIGPLDALKGKYGERLLPLALDVWGRVIAGSVYARQPSRIDPVGATPSTSTCRSASSGGDRRSPSTQRPE